MTPARMIAVGLLVDSLIGACGGEPAGATEPPVARPLAPGLTNAPTAKPAKTATTASYENCAAAKAAGVAPLHRGDPGYRLELDRDDDGIACE
jgi:hypothetical protein